MILLHWLCKFVVCGRAESLCARINTSFLYFPFCTNPFISSVLAICFHKKLKSIRIEGIENATRSCVVIL